MINKLHIENLGTVTNVGDYVKFSIQSPYRKLKGVSLFSEEGFHSAYVEEVAVELAVVGAKGDVNLLNDMIGLKRKHIDEHRSILRKLDYASGRENISGYAKCIENTTGAPLTLKLYLMFE